MFCVSRIPGVHPVRFGTVFFDGPQRLENLQRWENYFIFDLITLACWTYFVNMKMYLHHISLLNESVIEIFLHRKRSCIVNSSAADILATQEPKESIFNTMMKFLLRWMIKNGHWQTIQHNRLRLDHSFVLLSRVSMQKLQETLVISTNESVDIDGSALHPSIH